MEPFFSELIKVRRTSGSILDTSSREMITSSWRQCRTDDTLNCIGSPIPDALARIPKWKNVPSSRGMRRRPRSAARAVIPAVVAAIACIYS